MKRFLDPGFDQRAMLPATMIILAVVCPGLIPLAPETWWVALVLTTLLTVAAGFALSAAHLAAGIYGKQEAHLSILKHGFVCLFSKRALHLWDGVKLKHLAKSLALTVVGILVGWYMRHR